MDNGKWIISKKREEGEREREREREKEGGGGFHVGHVKVVGY